jgi:hypothetical protein
MADKQFIGKVFEKTFNNGGSVIKLTLTKDDVQKLDDKGNEGLAVTIDIKKSQKGKWYAEISQYLQVAPASGPVDETPF